MLSMTKQYRAELKTLAAAEKKMRRDYGVVARALGRQADAHLRERDRAQARLVKELKKLHRRRAILEGRLG